MLELKRAAAAAAAELTAEDAAHVLYVETGMPRAAAGAVYKHWLQKQRTGGAGCSAGISRLPAELPDVHDERSLTPPGDLIAALHRSLSVTALPHGMPPAVCAC
jgi:hypothetical protein